MLLIMRRGEMWSLWMLKCVPYVHVVVANRLSRVIDGTKIVSEH